MKIIVFDEESYFEFEKWMYRFHPHKRISKVHKVGHVHAEMNVECPDGGKNCRNCGDPEFKEQCSSLGHCPNCGTSHGIAPNSVLIKNGLKLV
jgi:predicted Zn-ribbon and HTH transcriptional regulator